ncbi:unnamed protein product, partial [Effrenium voratum]
PLWIIFCFVSETTPAWREAMFFRYYLTFIDETCAPESGARRRAQSAPLARTFRDLLPAAFNEEEESRKHVAATLTKRARDLRKPAAARVPDSTGSRGHPEICRRPCVHMAKGSCKDGAGCAFCHLPHTTPLVNLNKQLRLQLGKMDETQLLSVVIPHFRERFAPSGDESRLGQDFVQVLQQELERRSGFSASQEPAKENQKLDEQMRRMSLTGLFGLLGSKRFKEDHIPQLAKEVLENLRAARAINGD